MRLLVTGATGYIGQALLAKAHEENIQIIAASRKKPEGFDGPWHSFSLHQKSAPDLPKDLDAIIYLAAEANPKDPEAEIATAEAWIKKAEENNIRFVFVSSQTALSDNPEPYGAVKKKIEERLTGSNASIVRLGQVYGGVERGLYGTLLKLVRSSCLLPAFFPAPQIQPIHIDDAACGLLRIVKAQELRHSYNLAQPNAISFTAFLSYLSKNVVKKNRWFLPVPVAPVLAASKLFPFSFALSRLRSLFSLKSMETQASLDALGLRLRPLRGCTLRRSLLLEGRALMLYLYPKAPPSLWQRYARMIIVLREGAVLPLPALFLKYPFLLALLDAPLGPWRSRRQELVWRLDAATRLLEATPLGAELLLGKPQEKQSWICTVFSLGVASAFEGFWFVLGFLFAPFLFYKERTKP